MDQPDSQAFAEHLRYFGGGDEISSSVEQAGSCKAAFYFKIGFVYKILEDVPRSTPRYLKVLDPIRAKTLVATA